MGEPPFVVFLLAALLVSLVAIKRARGRVPGIGWGVLAGALLGLAFASKLTAIIALAAVLLWGTWAACGSFVVRRLPMAVRPQAPEGSRWLVWSFGVVVIAVLTFVVTNPYLYHDPIGRAWLLFQNRQAEMTAQAAIDPSRAVTSLPDRARQVWKYSLIEDTWAHTRLRWQLEAALAVVGFAWLLVRGVRLQPGADSFLLLWVLGVFGGVTVGLGYMLDHYFVPTATMGIALGGLAVGWGAQLAWHAVTATLRRSGPAPTTQEAQGRDIVTA
jgi:hypothetical protein